jgi:ATP-dependent protease ClpP protease subunit
MPPVILIYSIIGTPGEPNDYCAFSQDRFQSELAAAVSVGSGAVQVRLNSVGGNWLMAQGIVALIKASALKIDTYCDGIAASSASMIFMAGRKRLMRAHARLMIHNCSGPAAGQIGDLEKAIEGQRAINESMALLYTHATGLPIEKIREMMALETWLSAEDAVRLGFATGIIDAPKSATPPPADLTSSTAEASLLQLQAFYGGQLSNASQTSTMKNLLLPILQANAVAHPSLLAGITAASTDEQVTGAVTAAFTELATTRTGLATATAAVTTLTDSLATATAAATQAEADKATAEAELKTFKDKAAEDEKAAGEKAVSDLVANAVTVGKITAELAPHYTTLAVANLASTTALLDKLPARKSLVTEVTASAAGAGIGKLTAAAAMAEINAKGTTKGND